MVPSSPSLLRLQARIRISDGIECHRRQHNRNIDMCGIPYRTWNVRHDGNSMMVHD
jgi:hypothetical protein